MKMMEQIMDRCGRRHNIDQHVPRTQPAESDIWNKITAGSVSCAIPPSLTINCNDQKSNHL